MGPSRVMASALKARAEIALSFAIVSGWALLTFGAAQFVGHRVWPISAGLLAFSLCGWQYLGKLFFKGLYALTREKPRG